MEILNIEINSIIKNMDIEKIIGENIKKFRKRKGFTKQDIAKILEVKWDTVNKWEKGIFKPGLDKLQKLAELFEASLDDFLKPPAPEPFPGFNEVMELPVRERYIKIEKLAVQHAGIPAELVTFHDERFAADKIPLLETEEQIVKYYKERLEFWKKKANKIRKILEEEE